MTNEELLAIGFEKLPHRTIGDMIIYRFKHREYGENRHITVSCCGSPNEMVFLSETDEDDDRKINDTLVLRNFDYDGYTTIEHIKAIIFGITGKQI